MTNPAARSLWRFEPHVLLYVGVMAISVSLQSPHDRTTWWLEASPVIVAALLLIATAPRFPLTRLAYRLIFLHAIVLLVGAHWTYARVPLGEWAREWFGWQRNHYDRLGHFAQGFVPAIVVRELLIRLRVVATRRWLVVVVTAIALALSACYELVEWVAALLLGKGAEDFLGTQGDPWDTQCDMALALAGALLAQLLLGRWHDAQIARVTQVEPRRAAKLTPPAARP